MYILRNTQGASVNINYATKTYGEVGVQFHTFLIFVTGHLHTMAPSHLG